MPEPVQTFIDFLTILAFQTIKIKNLFSKCLELCPVNSVTISEDYSRKTRDSRDKLRKFGREIRKGNPEKKIQMRYTKITHTFILSRHDTLS